MPSPPLSIVQSLSPRVAVLSSEGVIKACEANGCRGLEELLRPWEGGTERVSILSSTLTPGVHPNFPLRFVAFDSVFPNPAAAAPDSGMVVDMVSSFVGDRRPDEEQHYPLTRSLLLSSRPVAPHETFNHPVAIVFAVSTTDPDPSGAMKRLVQTHVGALQTVPWMDALNVLKFYVVVHDVSEGQDETAAIEVLANVKRSYGNHSTLVTINSLDSSSAPLFSPDIQSHPSIPLPRPLTPQDASADPSTLSQIYASALSSLTLSPLSAASAAMGFESVAETSVASGQPPRRKLYASRLSAEDTQRIVALVRELVVQSLIPWMEARVREWNEVYHANRRGITGRLFGAGRKLFSSRPSSPAQNSAQAGYNSVKGYYPVAAVEALSRRLADFAFMLRDYRFASTVYDSLRRDYAQDRANRYAAAATEMYGLSQLLSHTYFLPSTPPKLPNNPFTTLQHTDISSWLEQAVATYYSSGPGGNGVALQLDALRATVLYYEAWKMIGEWRGVGQALVRAAGEAEEVAGAVIIEEAAVADTKGGKTEKGKRRRAFNLVLAARRYETAGLKAHSRRCLDRASAIYRSAPWTAAQDRIEYSLGRQAYASGEMGGAVQHFLHLLGKDDNGVMGSQAGPLQDMELAYEQLATHSEQLEATKDTLRLPSPIFDLKQTRIVTIDDADAASSSAGRHSLPGTSPDTEAFSRLEQRVLDTWDRKGKKPARLLPEPGKAVVSYGEEFQVHLVAVNPLNCPLSLSKVTVTLDPPVEAAIIGSIEDISLDAREARLISVPITIPPPVASSSIATADSEVRITAVSFLFNRFFPVLESLSKRGKRLHATKEQRLTASYARDSSLDVFVVPPRPRIRAEWVELPEWLYEGETRKIGLKLRAEGRAVRDLRLHMGQLGLIRLKSDSTQGIAGQASRNTMTQDDCVRLPVETLDAGQEVTVPLILEGRRQGDVSHGYAPVAIDISALLVGSDASDDIDAASDSSIGHSRLHGQMTIAPLLQSRARVKPVTDGFAVLVEVRNISGLSVVLDRIASISPYWRSEPIRLAEDTVISPNQVIRCRSLVTAPTTVQKALDLQQRQMVEQLSLLVQNKPSPDIPQAHPPIDIDIPSDSIASFLSSRTSYRSEYLNRSFPTISTEQSRAIFPLFDPLDLDFCLAYSVSGTSNVDHDVADQPERKGYSFIHGIRPSPAFSLVEDLKLQVQRDLASGNKSVRTMYEETGRIRRALVDSVLEGVLAVEDDPVFLAVDIPAAESEAPTGLSEVRFCLRNTSPGVAVRWVLQLNSPQAHQSHANSGSRPSSGRIWTGKTFYKGQLAPNDSETVVCKLFATDQSSTDSKRSSLQSSLTTLPGWRLDVEAGDVGKDNDGPEIWIPRKNWSGERA